MADETRVAASAPEQEVLRRLREHFNDPNGKWLTVGDQVVVLNLLDLAAAFQWARDCRDIEGLEDQFEAALDRASVALSKVEGKR